LLQGICEDALIFAEWDIGAAQTLSDKYASNNLGQQNTSLPYIISRALGLASSSFGRHVRQVQKVA
jgi:hypothetical protein